MTRKANCECLAAWVDNEPCICDEPIGPPMEVSAKRLREADQLVREIQAIDRAIKAIDGKRFCRTLIWHGSDDRVEVTLPPDIAAGVLRTMRFHAHVKLSETGVVTTSSGHRPVVSA